MPDLNYQSVTNDGSADYKTSVEIGYIAFFMNTCVHVADGKGKFGDSSGNFY